MKKIIYFQLDETEASTLYDFIIQENISGLKNFVELQATKAYTEGLNDGKNITLKIHEKRNVEGLE